MSYLPRWWWKAHGGGSTVLKDTIYWGSDYSDRPNMGSYAGKKPEILQYTCEYDAHAKGIRLVRDEHGRNHGIDMNRVPWSVEEFRKRVGLAEEDLSIMDEKTERYLDKQFETVLKRMKLAVQRVGGKENSVYSGADPDLRILSWPRMRSLKPRRQGRRPSRPPTAWPRSWSIWASSIPVPVLAGKRPLPARTNHDSPEREGALPWVIWAPEGYAEAAPTDGGSWTGGGRKGLLHTTEGRTAADAFAAFKNKGSWPHSTASFAGNRFQIWQHIPLNRASRSLGNPAGGVETNRGNVIQIELVGTADERLAEHLDAPSLYVENWPAKYLAEIAAWMRWVEANFAVPRRCTVRFLKYPASAGANNPNRLSPSDWVKYAGWLGHQHAPEQVKGHGDPGLINIAALLADVEDLSIADEKTEKYLDEQFETVLKRMKLAVQRVGGKRRQLGLQRSRS